MPAGPQPQEPFAAVYFDCDSTLSAIEGVDELLRFCPSHLRADIAAMTRDAMEGRRQLADVYEARLRLLAPHRDLLLRIGELYVQHAVPDAAAVVHALRALGKQVGIVSGGMLVPVQVLARHLGIEPANVHAVPLVFAADGSYVDFDRQSPLWRNGGKVEVLRALPASHRPVAFVGDGATDLEAQGQVDRFVGYGGVAIRAVVEQRSEFWCATKSLAGLLPFLCTAEELALLARRSELPMPGA
jgi:phosphoserine phosphatase